MPETSISLSPLDETRFGFRTARAFVQNLTDLPLIEEFCQKENVEFLILRCETDKIELVHALEAKDFSLMNTLLYFRYLLSAENILPREKETVFYIQPEDEVRIKKITQSAFADYRSHYHADPRFDPRDCDEGYLDWAVRSCRKEIADEVLVAKSNGQVKGFLTLRKNSSDEVEGPLFSVSPEAQGQGLGRNLIKAAFAWAYKEGAKEFIISTQITNLASQNLWVGLGMKLNRSLYTFHKWFDEEK